MLEIGRQKRPDLYDLQADKVRTLINRSLRFEVEERMDYKGQVVRPIDRFAVRELLEKIKDSGAESVAVMLLNAYLNPENERLLREEIEEALPEVFLTISSDLSKQFREYERLCGTVLNSFVGPEVKKYISRLRGYLKADPSLQIDHEGDGYILICLAD